MEARDSSGISVSQGHQDEASPAIDPGVDRRQRVLDQFNSFPFSSDEVFQQGLAGILAHRSVDPPAESDRSDLVLKTKVFYFNRVTGHDLTLEDVLGGDTADMDRFPADSGNEPSQTSSGAEHGEMRTLTFSELKRLIVQGKTDDIPNNKIIPDTLNDGVPSESTAPLRRKPWELST